MSNIRYYRKQAGLTQEGLADLCGWDGNSRIGNYEAGIRKPGTDDLLLIRDALATKDVRVTLEQLIGEHEAKTA